MQMYLVLPLLFVFSRRSRTVYPLLMLWVVAALLAEASFHAPRHILRNVFEYAPCFVPGIIAYKLSQRSRPQFPFLAWPVALALATAIFLQHPVPDRGWICCLLIGASVPQFREMPAGYVRKGCQLIARYSYGIYLTHFICIWFAFERLQHAPQLVRWIVFLGTLTGIPVLLYHALEAPMISLGSGLMERLRRE